MCTQTSSFQARFQAEAIDASAYAVHIYIRREKNSHGNWCCTKQQLVIDNAFVGPRQGTMKLDRRLDRRNRLQSLFSLLKCLLPACLSAREPRTRNDGNRCESVVFRGLHGLLRKVSASGCRQIYIGFILPTNKYV